MPAWENEVSGKFIYAKIGEPPIKFTVKDTRRVDGVSKYNLKNKTGDLGYHYQILTTKGEIVSVNTWVLLKELSANDVKEGDTIAISRPEHGKYVVSKKPNSVVKMDVTTKAKEEISQPKVVTKDMNYLSDIMKKYGVKKGEEETAWDDE